MNKFIHTVALFAIILSGTFSVKGQLASTSTKLYFLSDCQQPLKAEKLYLKYYRNEEARDSLFSDLIRQKPQNLFLLGDLTSVGAYKKSWEPLDSLLIKLHKQNTFINAISGNHEYYGNAKKGLRNFRKRFPQNPISGYYVITDSIAVVMLNSNFTNLTSLEIQKQQIWYEKTMDSLDFDWGVKVIIVCAHHAPYTNSKITGPSKPVIANFVPVFLKATKTKLFVSGHSHNLEYFQVNSNKHFLVIGGGGGLSQPLLLPENRLYPDLLPQDQKPLYFYVTLERRGNSLILNARGLQKDFSSVKGFVIGRIE